MKVTSANHSHRAPLPRKSHPRPKVGAPSTTNSIPSCVTSNYKPHLTLQPLTARITDPSHSRLITSQHRSVSATDLPYNTNRAATRGATSETDHLAFPRSAIYPPYPAAAAPMAGESGAPLLAYIRNAGSYSEQATALRSLKNDIVGHAQKKEAWLVQGALEPVVALLQASGSSSKAATGKPGRQTDAHALNEEENVRLQALQVLGSFASGMSPCLSCSLSLVLTISCHRWYGFPRAIAGLPGCSRHPLQPLP